MLKYGCWNFFICYLLLARHLTIYSFTSPNIANQSIQTIKWYRKLVFFSLNFYENNQNEVLSNVNFVHFFKTLTK